VFNVISRHIFLIICQLSLQKGHFEDKTMNWITRACCVLVALTIISSCSSNSSSSLAEAPPQNSVSVEEYKIGAGDQLSINVWRNEDLSLPAVVRPDGKISLPLIGDVQASGVTAQQLSENLRDELVNFIRNPQVTVIVASADSTDYQQRVRITGAVNSPLSLPYRDGMTVLDLILEAQGLNDFAIANRSKLYRKNQDGVIDAYSINLADILFKGKLATNYEVPPGDIVTVPERIL